MSRHRFALVITALVLPVAACGKSSSPTAATSPPTEAETIASSSAPATAPPNTGLAVASTKGLMPQVVCMNLQAAQDKIQADAGVFYSKSHDATGRERHQILDRDWIVVAQRPPAGARIGEGDAVLEVVEYGEPNSCPNGG